MAHRRSTPERDANTPLSNASGKREGDGSTAGKSSKGGNPFRMPSDEEVFSVRDEERRRREEERKKQLNLPVSDKGTWASRAFASTADFVKSVDSRAITKNPPISKTGLPEPGTTKERRREKENMAEFIAKKREMFLVQMSLDTKRAEIRKLEEQAQQREEALRKSEQMLEEDAMRFDAFLKENDYKAVDAIRKAEQETKAKQEKVSEIKKLTAQIAAVRSDMARFEEQLEDCRRYRVFLERLAPEDWRKEQQAKRAKRKAARKAAADSGGSETNRTTASTATKGAEEEAQQEGEGNQFGLEDDDDPELFFTAPQQLLDIFAALEERNLFLIQNSQETEEALEELRQKLEETKSTMTSETTALQNQIDHLLQNIDTEQRKASAVAVRTHPVTQSRMPGIASTGADASSVLEELNKRVSDVYNRCGFDTDASLGTLQMLANVESRLEEYLSIIERLPPAYVEEAEKAKERERRLRVREEKLEQQRVMQEERIRRSIERSQAPVPKKTGKPVMFRAPPIRKKKKAETLKATDGDEEDDVREFFVE